jgi:hypothetical protein
MNAEQFLNESLGGNMNISTLKPLSWHETMEGYARHKLKVIDTILNSDIPYEQMDAALKLVAEKFTSTNKQSTPCSHSNMEVVQEYRCADCGWVSSTY